MFRSGLFSFEVNAGNLMKFWFSLKLFGFISLI